MLAATFNGGLLREAALPTLKGQPFGERFRLG